LSPSGSSYSSGRTSLEKALQKLKHFCGYQERSHAEARQKLFSLGLFKTEVEELLRRLIEEGYLNEERYAHQFASGKFRIRGWGKQKIRHELRQKGVSVFFITQALNALDETEYQKSFEHAALKKWTSLREEKNIFVRKYKWHQFLLQRGYEPVMIKSWTFPEESESGNSPQ
jgi:regulatory protein